MGTGVAFVTGAASHVLPLLCAPGAVIRGTDPNHLLQSFIVAAAPSRQDPLPEPPFPSPAATCVSCPHGRGIFPGPGHGSLDMLFLSLPGQA